MHKMFIKEARIMIKVFICTIVFLIFIARFRWPSDSKLLEYKIRNLINSEDSQALIDFFNSVCPEIYNITSLVNFILGMFATTEKFSTKMFVEFNENALSHLPKTEVECIKVHYLKYSLSYLKLDYLLLAITRKYLHRLKYPGCCN